MSDRDEEQQRVQPHGQEGWMSTEGTVDCEGTAFDWSFSMDSSELVARLVQDRGHSERDAAEELRAWLADQLGERVFLLISEFLWQLGPGGDPIDACDIRESPRCKSLAVENRDDILAGLRARLKQKQTPQQSLEP